MELAEYTRNDDRNKFWKLQSGVAQNLLDEAIDRIADLEAQLAAAQERNTKLQSEHLDHVNALNEQLTAAQERGVVLARGILAVQNLINESRGVDGYHRNGNIAEWDELLDDGCMLDEYSKALHLIHKTTTDSLRETSRTARTGGRP